MATQTFSDGAMLRHGWEKTMSSLGLLIGATLIAFLVTIIPIAIMGFIDSSIIQFVLFLAYMFLTILMAVGLIRITLAISDGKKVEIGMLFQGVDVWLPFFAVSVLYGLIVTVGFFLFVIPGIIWGIKYMFAPILVIDQKMGPIDALVKSGEMTMGYKWDLFGFQYVTQAVNSLGMLVFFVGMIVTFPITAIATMGVYRHLGPKSTKS